MGEGTQPSLRRLRKLACVGGRVGAHGERDRCDNALRARTQCRFARRLSLEGEGLSRSAAHPILRFSADVLPRLLASSYETVCPSLRVLNPARSTAEM